MRFHIRHLVILFLLFTGCTKTDPVAEAKSMLADYSGGQKSWQLTGLTVNGQVQTLGPVELKYTKTYFFNGKYADTDSYEGDWRLDSETEILEVYNNLPNGLMFQKYKIEDVTTNKLTLSYQTNGEHVITYYTAVK